MAKNSNHYLWQIDRWNGGESEFPNIGIPGSYRYGQSLDTFSNPAILQVARDVTNEINNLAQDMYWFDYNPATGIIYMYGEDRIYSNNAGTYSSIRTLSGDLPNGQGMAYYNGYLYYRRSTTLGRYDFTTFTDSWQTGLTASGHAPMTRFLNYLCVANGRYVGTVDDTGTWDADRITLPPNTGIETMFAAGLYLVIITKEGSGNVWESAGGYMYLWDGISTTYNEAIPLPVVCTAGIHHEDKILLIGGRNPTIYESNGGVPRTVMAVPGYTPDKYSFVHAGAIDIYQNKVVFGIGTNDDPSIKKCVYTYGSQYATLQRQLVPSYIATHGDIQQDDFRITGLKVIGGKLRFAWENETEPTRGIDVVSQTAYEGEAIYRSLIFDNGTPYSKTPVRAFVEFDGALAEGESVTIKIGSDPWGDPTFANSATTVSKTEDSDGYTELELPLGAEGAIIRGRELHLELRLTGTSTTRPGVKRVWVEVIEDTDLL